MMFGSGDSFDYAECSGCGTVRLIDVPDDLSAFYPPDYYSIANDPENTLGRFPKRQAVRGVVRSATTGLGLGASLARAILKKGDFNKLSAIRLAGLPRGRSTSILEVGCGSGMLVYALSLAGLRNTIGIDPFAPEDRTFSTGASIRKLSLADVTGAFDLVMMHHSLEHVADPGDTLERARDVLSQDGRILVRMPTVSSLAYRTYGQHWVQLDAPRHLSVLSRQGMARLCRSKGLDVVAVRDDSTSFQFWGSEQVRRHIPMKDPRSYFVSPTSSGFNKVQMATWTQAAVAANRAGDGDQAVWVLRASRTASADRDGTQDR